MPFEDIQIRIARDGRVYVHVDGISEARIRDLREFLEEQIGPVQSLEIVQSPDWDRPAALAAEDEVQAEDELKLDQGW